MLLSSSNLELKMGSQTFTRTGLFLRYSFYCLLFLLPCWPFHNYRPRNCEIIIFHLFSTHNSKTSLVEFHDPGYNGPCTVCRHFRTCLLTYLKYFPISFPLFLSWWTLLILQKTVITYSLVWHANTDTILILEFLTWLLTMGFYPPKCDI